MLTPSSTYRQEPQPWYMHAILRSNLLTHSLGSSSRIVGHTEFQRLSKPLDVQLLVWDGRRARASSVNHLACIKPEISIHYR